MPQALPTSYPQCTVTPSALRSALKVLATVAALVGESTRVRGVIRSMAPAPLASRITHRQRGEDVS
eukprot:1330531-Alexandrium_andersonii.AAC.1